MPTYSGIGPVVQLLVPVAVPDPPVELDHVTCATPTLSCAVPLTTIELAEVATVVMAGERMVTEGGTADPPVPGLTGGFTGGLRRISRTSDYRQAALGGWLVTVTLWNAWSCVASDAVTVITFAPTLRGMAAMVQFAEPCAVPDGALIGRPAHLHRPRPARRVYRSARWMTRWSLRAVLEWSVSMATRRATLGARSPPHTAAGWPRYRPAPAPDTM